MTDKDSKPDAALERRATKRFPIEQEVLYKILDHRAVTPESGSGKTIDISSKGVLFGTTQRLRSGKRIEVAVNWPVPLEGGCLLKFVAVGRVVRSEESRAAVRIEQYEFRTRRSKEPIPDAAGKPASAPVPYY